MVLRHFDPAKFEQVFHPSMERYGYFVPYVPTVLGRETVEKEKEIVAELKEKGYENAVKGKKIICASADGHSYGLQLIDTVWREMNADVVNAGTNMEAAFVLDLADEEDADVVIVSVHCGQSLDYAKLVSEISQKRNKKYNVVMGGMLNAMLPGYTEPVDVADLINEIGVFATNDFEKQINYIAEK